MIATEPLPLPGICARVFPDFMAVSFTNGTPAKPPSGLIEQWTTLVAFASARCNLSGAMNRIVVNLALANELDEQNVTCLAPPSTSGTSRFICIVAVRHLKGIDPVRDWAARAVAGGLKRAWKAACDARQVGGPHTGPVLLLSPPAAEEAHVRILSQLTAEVQQPGAPVSAVTSSATSSPEEVEDDDFQQVLSWIADDAKREREEDRRSSIISPSASPDADVDMDDADPKRQKVSTDESVWPSAPPSPPRFLPLTSPLLPNEYFQSASEYLGAGLLAIAAALFGYDDVGMAVVYFIVVCHTIVTALTDLGPRTRDSHLRFPFAPIDPYYHKYFDCAFVAFQLTCIGLMPQHFGATPHHAALFVMAAGGGDILMGAQSALANMYQDDVEKHRQLKMIHIRRGRIAPATKGEGKKKTQ